MDNILEVQGVGKQFRDHVALQDMNLAVPRGSIYGLLGPNGAGKTTLIRIINRITLPDSGTVTFDGHPLSEKDVAHIGYLPEERGLYKKMKVGEQALFFARLKGLDRATAIARLRFWFDKFGISDWWGKKVEELSKGMAQKVQFIITVLHEPKLLIFDEPFSGFDPINAELLKNEILQLRERGASVIFSTHNMASVEEICDDITLINKSRSILSGNVEQIRSQYCRGRYSVRIEGPMPADLLTSLEQIASNLTYAPTKDARGVDIQLRLASDKDVRSVIGLINEKAEICSFNRAMASMNDIFIDAVSQNNIQNEKVTAPEQ